MRDVDGLCCLRQGDQYDVREKGGERDVRNLGAPVELAARYFEEGADEVSAGVTLFDEGVDKVTV